MVDGGSGGGGSNRATIKGVVAVGLELSDQISMDLSSGMERVALLFETVALATGHLGDDAKAMEIAGTRQDLTEKMLDVLEAIARLHEWLEELGGRV